ncbi:pyrroline-5-carboxylate reductase [Liberibacter crescens]|nr:pyrroline-5-carboxylate reductase [Liberibacter crescens]
MRYNSMNDNLGIIALVGAGKMGTAILSGWLEGGIPPSSMMVIDPKPSIEATAKIREYNIAYKNIPPQNIKAEIVLIAVKPHDIDTVIPIIKSLIEETTIVISIAAGKTLAYFRKNLGDIAIIRAMPNIAATVKCSVTAVFANKKINSNAHQKVNKLLSILGTVEWLLKEEDMDIVTALSGSGPAYLFYLIECMANAACKLGLPQNLSVRLARDTIIGSSELIRQSTDEISTLRENVTSPGGTTEKALSVLLGKDGMQALFDKALAAAQMRSKEIAN